MPLSDFNNTFACFALASLLCISGVNAEPFETIESLPIGELWLNPGFYSYHPEQNLGFNNSNYGFGGEYRYSTVSSVTLGFFENSVRETSHYAGWYWQPIAFGALRMGAVLGGLDGYPKMNNGGLFLAAIPTVSVEYKSVGANVMLIPGYRDRLHSSISFQLKLKVF